MPLSVKTEARLRSLGLFAILLCGVGTIVGMFVVLVRVPAVAATKQELLSLTLQGVGVSLLFAVAALVIALTLMVRRRDRQPEPMA